MWFKIRAAGFGVQFSPFAADRLAVCTGQNFGIVGRGYLAVYHFTPTQLTETVGYETPDSLFDCCWSEIKDTLLVTAGADGIVCLYDIEAPSPDPVSVMKEHAKEVACVQWNQQRKDVFLSSGWDGLIKLWNPMQQGSLMTFVGHQHAVYSVAWNVITPNTFASASGDLTVKVWDDRSPAATMSWLAHQNEVLSIDWCKYDEHLLVSGSVDKRLHIWDVRKTHQPLRQLIGHRYAVKRCLFSPHSPDLVLSCSYDMSVRLWDLSQPTEGISHQRVWEHHSEFVSGIDFSNHEEGRVASVGWDEKLETWNVHTGN